MDGGIRRLHFAEHYPDRLLLVAPEYGGVGLGVDETFPIVLQYGIIRGRVALPHNHP